jgi:arylsulfatase A-like enzyme
MRASLCLPPDEFCLAMRSGRLDWIPLLEPVSVNGTQQRPIEGVSMLYSFNDAKAAEQHETQYFEMFGNRGIYHKG